MTKYTQNVNNFSIEKDERFNYFNTHGWQVSAFLKVMNGLDNKNKILKKRIQELEKENIKLKKELFEARKDYIMDTADISDKLYFDEMVEEVKKEIYGDVE